MGGWPVYCVMASWKIDDDTRDLLFGTAYLMIKTGRNRRRVRGDGCEGVVTTEFQRASLSGLSGVQFRAELETDDGKLIVKYIVRDHDFEEMEKSECGAWIDPHDPPDDLEEHIRENPVRKAAQSYKWN